MEEYVPTKTARKMLGVTTQTLRNWDSSGKLDTKRAPSGVRLYSLKDIKDILGCNHPLTQKEKIAYCRVSSKKQLDDLERQKDFFRREYPNHTLVTDVGSGINWKRKGLQALLERSMSGDISEIVVAHRDRLCRFAFELIEGILQRQGVKLIVLDREEGESESKELADDILSIIHVYSCRQMGRRRYGNKNKEGQILSFSIPEEDNQGVDWNKPVCLQPVS